MATTATPRGKSQTHLLHGDISSPPLKPWKGQRLLRCEIGTGERRSAQLGPAQDSRRPDRRIGGGDNENGLKDLREKLLGHLRETADKLKLEMPPIGPATPAMERVCEPKPEPGRSSIAAETDRPWNLRTRRTTGRTLAGSSALPSKAVERTVRLRSESSEKKEKKRRFSISLSHEEIEEDVFALTGSRPRRRPKKRPRNVQWQLDAVFPGLWLSEITPELYKVAG